MTLRLPTSRRFEPGTTGWTVEDLDDPLVAARWARGGYEIIEGVLTKMPAAYIEGSIPLRKLVRAVERHMEGTNTPGEFGFEMDLVVNRIRVPRVDAVLLTPEQLERQKQIQASLAPQRGRKRTYGRLRVPPLLAIECVSEGHEDHDWQTKRRWYAQIGVAHYWILDPYRRTLDCFVLRDGAYAPDAAGHDSDEVKPSLFADLVIQLKQVWI